MPPADVRASAADTDATAGEGPTPAPRELADRVLDAALELLVERTYGGTAVPEVAARAGVGVGSIYRYFPGKQAMANAVFSREKAALLDVLTAALEAADPHRGCEGEVQALWAALARFAEARPSGFAFLEHQQHAAYLDERSLELSAQVDALVADVVRRGQRSGDLRDGDPQLLIALAFGAFVGISKAARARGQALTTAEVTAAGAAVWDLLRAR